MFVLVVGAIAVSRRLSLIPSTTQAFFELVVDTVDSQIRDTMRLEPGPYRAFIGTLFVFIFVCNWSSLVPGVEPPTAHLETDAALALLVFLAIIWFGIRAGGVRDYLGAFASPTPLMIPLNLVEILTRTFSLLVRLFGNVMSGVFVIGIVLSLAGLLVPIPLMALDLLTGAVIGKCFARHRAREFRAFLNVIEAGVPSDLALASLKGAPPLLAMALGTLVARRAVMRRVGEMAP